MSLTDIKSALLPHKYILHKSKSIKTACFLLLCAYLISFVCIACSLRSFTNGIFKDVTSFLSQAENFELAGDKFTFVSDQKSCYIENIDLSLTVDTDADYHDVPENDDRTHLISVFIAGNGFYVNFDGIEYSLSINELFGKVGEFAFSKANIEGYLSSGTNILFNIIFSALIFAVLLFIFVIAVCVLLVSLIIRLIKSLIKCPLDFMQIMFISIGSLIYPVLFIGFISVFPNSVLFVAVYFFDILRLLVAAVLLYVLFAMYPFFTNSSKNNTVKE